MQVNANIVRQVAVQACCRFDVNIKLKGRQDAFGLGSVARTDE